MKLNADTHRIHPSSNVHVKFPLFFFSHLHFGDYFFTTLPPYMFRLHLDVVSLGHKGTTYWLFHNSKSYDFIYCWRKWCFIAMNSIKISDLKMIFFNPAIELTFKLVQLPNYANCFITTYHNRLTIMDIKFWKLTWKLQNFEHIELGSIQLKAVNQLVFQFSSPQILE